MSWLLLYPDDGDVYVMEHDRTDLAYDRGITYLETQRLTEYLDRLEHQDILPFPASFAIAPMGQPRPKLITHQPNPFRTSVSQTWLLFFPDGELFLMEGSEAPIAREYFATERQTLKLLHCLRHLNRLRDQDYPPSIVFATPETPKPIPQIPYAASVG